MIRSILFFLVFWPIFGLYITLLWPITRFASQKFVFTKVFRVCTRYLLLCLRVICRLKYRIDGENFLRTPGPAIISCNHQSTWETFIFSLFFDELSIVIKKELLDIPIARLYFRRLGCIPVDRASPVSAIRTLLAGAQSAVAKGQSILIFPNGSRSGDESYKIGVYALYNRLNLPVIPARVDSGRYWPPKSFKKFPGTITLQISDPIPPGLPKTSFFHKLHSHHAPG